MKGALILMIIQLIVGTFMLGQENNLHDKVCTYCIA